MDNEIRVSIDTERPEITLRLEDSSTSLINYNYLLNKPKIEDVELIGNKTFRDFGVMPIQSDEINNLI